MDRIECPMCDGSGRTHLQEVLQETLNEVRRTPGCKASEFLDRFPGIGVTAINNRLEGLRRFRLVKRERKGHTWRYFPVKKGKQ